MEQTTYTDRLLLALEKRGFKCDSQESMNRAANALVKALGFTYQAAMKVLKGETKYLRVDNHAKVAVWLEVNAYWLATGEGPRTSSELAVMWPFSRLKPSDFAALDSYERNAVEEAARAKLAEFMQLRDGGSHAPRGGGP